MSIIQKLVAVWTGVHTLACLTAMYISIFAHSETAVTLSIAEFFLASVGAVVLAGTWV